MPAHYINNVVMSEKKSFALRIDEATFKALEKWATDEFRSVNGQIEYILNKALKDSGRIKTIDDSKNSQTKKIAKALLLSEEGLSNFRSPGSHCVRQDN